ncbi:hypothetical protein JTB14_029714 [Gonioctena quinquepunctata]|nr:hypothetical protein JTB14_029714 [Gonioctena quinquepunctata]
MGNFSFDSHISNIEDDGYLLQNLVTYTNNEICETSDNMMHPPGPSEVENTAGEGGTHQVMPKEGLEKKEKSLNSEDSLISLNQDIKPPKKKRGMTSVVDGVAIKREKRKIWSLEQIEVKTAAWEENQKKKSNKGICECGGTEKKLIFLVGKEDYRVKRMCRGSIAETSAVCDIELVSKKDSDCIRQTLQENEQFESEYAKNTEPSLSGKNAEEVMEVNLTEDGKSKALEPGTPIKASKYKKLFNRDKQAYEREKVKGKKLRKKKGKTEEKKERRQGNV